MVARRRAPCSRCSCWRPPDARRARRRRPRPRRRRRGRVRRGAGTAPPAAQRAAARAEHAQAMARLRPAASRRRPRCSRAAARARSGQRGLRDRPRLRARPLGRRAEAEAVLRGAIEKDPRRFYAYVNLAELLADDPARWERRDAIVAFLEKGLDALKDDRKGRFNLLLGLANFERAVGRTAAARARLEPLLAHRRRPAAVARAAQARARSARGARARRARARARGLAAARRRARPTPRRPTAAARALDSGRADERARASPRRWSQRYPTWPRALRAARARARGAGRVDEAARDLEIAVNLAPSNARRLARARARSWRSTAARWRRSAPTRRCATRSRWSRPGPTCASCATSSRAGAPSASPQAPPARATVPVGRSRAASTSRPRSGFDVGDPVGLGRELLDQALADSPGFVAAAVSSYALTGQVAARDARGAEERRPGPVGAGVGRAQARSDREEGGDAATTSRRWCGR